MVGFCSPDLRPYTHSLSHCANLSAIYHSTSLGPAVANSQNAYKEAVFCLEISVLCSLTCSFNLLQKRPGWFPTLSWPPMASTCVLTHTSNFCSSRSTLIWPGPVHNPCTLLPAPVSDTRLRRLRGWLLRNGLACEIDIPGIVCGLGEISAVWLGKKLAFPKRSSVSLWTEGKESSPSLFDRPPPTRAARQKCRWSWCEAAQPLVLTGLHRQGVLISWEWNHLPSALQNERDWKYLCLYPMI